MVDRGWVPFEMDEPPVAAASPPTGAVEVEGTLFAPQPGGAGEIQAGEDRVTTMRTVDVEAIGRDVPYELVGWFLQLSSQTPPSGEFPAPALRRSSRKDRTSATRSNGSRSRRSRRSATRSLCGVR